jgi:hypothetical protein
MKRTRARLGMLAQVMGQNSAKVRCRSIGSAVHHLAAIRVQDLSGHVARILAGEEQEARRHLVRLAGGAIGTLLPKSGIFSGGWPPKD